jgi:excisionase family DNA binding protein
VTDRLLTVAQVAAALALSPESVLRLIHRRELAAERHGRLWRVDPSDLANYRARARQDTEREVSVRRHATITPIEAGSIPRRPNWKERLL